MGQQALRNEWNDLGFVVPHPDVFKNHCKKRDSSISQLATFAQEKPLNLHHTFFNPSMKGGIGKSLGFSVITLITILTYSTTSNADSIGKGNFTR